MQKKMFIFLVFLLIIIVGVFYFDYLHLNKIEMEMLGNQITNFSIWDTWDDPGVVVLDNGKDISSKVEIKSDVDYKKVGTYTVKYTVNSFLLSKSITREVRITEAEKLVDFVFSLEGDTNYYLMNGNEYNEPGIIAIDAVDGDIRNKVEKESNLDVNENGTYQIKYAVKNSAGVTKKLTRNVIVYSFLVNKSLKTTEITSENEILLDIVDDNYNYAILPNGDKTTNRNINYVVTENGGYSFKIYDKNNNMLDYIVDITNIEEYDPIPRSYNYYSFKASDGRSHKYWLYIPEDQTGKEKFPLLVYLHGDGSKTNNIKDVNKYAFPKFIDSGMDFPYMMVTPQCSNETNFTSDSKMLMLRELIDYLVKNYNVDEERIIISGGSSGASGAFKMASTHKNLFSCLVIGSGVFFAAKAEDLTHLPIWLLHGELDKRVDEVQNLYNKINSLGGNAKLTIIPNGHHDITETVFKDPDLTDWMIKQKRK